MKERIYTIPLSEALEKDSECLLCTIEDKLSSDAVSYFTGAAMMEPDVRCETNENGFCAEHYAQMLKCENKLSLALVLQTRLSEVLKKLEVKPEKKAFLKKVSLRDDVISALDGGFSSCTACNRVAAQKKLCIQNFIFLLETEPDFKNKFFASKGLCIKHFREAAEYIKNEQLFSELLQKQQKETARIADEVNRYVLKFDYRNSGMEWNGAQNSPERATEKLRGTTIQKG